jgi:hypothetical protein
VRQLIQFQELIQLQERKLNAVKKISVILSGSEGTAPLHCRATQLLGAAWSL